MQWVRDVGDIITKVAKQTIKAIITFNDSSPFITNITKAFHNYIGL